MEQLDDATDWYDGVGGFGGALNAEAGSVCQETGFLDSGWGGCGGVPPSASTCFAPSFFDQGGGGSAGHPAIVQEAATTSPTVSDDSSEIPSWLDAGVQGAIVLGFVFMVWRMTRFFFGGSSDE